MTFAFQRADGIRPALNSSVERHGTDQEETESVTQVIWHKKNGQETQLEAEWKDEGTWFRASSGWWQRFLAFHTRTNAVRQLE